MKTLTPEEMRELYGSVEILKDERPTKEPHGSRRDPVGRTSGIARAVTDMLQSAYLRGYDDGKSDARQAREKPGVGDEVLVENGGEWIKAVVVDTDSDGALWLLNQYGCNFVQEPDIAREAKPTGKYYADIFELVEKLKGGK